MMIFFLRFPWILLLFFIEHHRSLSDAAPTTSIVNCDEYVNDFDVIQRFPFSVIVDPEEPFQSLFTSTVITYPNDNQSIQELTIREQDVVPPSFVCLRNLRELTVADTPFYQKIVPDQIAEMKKLEYLFIDGSPIDHMTERFSLMTQLYMFRCIDCQLKTLPDFSRLEKLLVVEVQYNQLKELLGLQNVIILNAKSNLFEELPIIANKNNVTFITANDNPLKNVQSILTYPNIQGIDLVRVGLRLLPTNIDKLTNLMYINVEGNHLTHLPRTILNLEKLEELNICKNSFTEKNLQAIQDNFKKYRPQTKLTTGIEFALNKSI